MSRDLTARLREMHADLKQGAMYEPHEDPDWDVTAAAADRIEALEDALELLLGGDDECSCGACEPWRHARDVLGNG